MRTQKQPLPGTHFPRLNSYIDRSILLAILAMVLVAWPAIGQSSTNEAKSGAQPVAQEDEPEANPGRPTVSNPATLIPVGYLQFETGTLGATNSLEFSTRYEFNEVVKLAVSRRLEFIESSEPAVHYTVNGLTANGTSLSERTGRVLTPCGSCCCANWRQFGQSGYRRRAAHPRLLSCTSSASSPS